MSAAPFDREAADTPRWSRAAKPLRLAGSRLVEEAVEILIDYEVLAPASPPPGRAEGWRAPVRQAARGGRQGGSEQAGGRTGLRLGVVGPDPGALLRLGRKLAVTSAEVSTGGFVEGAVEARHALHPGGTLTPQSLVGEQRPRRRGLIGMAQ